MQTMLFVSTIALVAQSATFPHYDYNNDMADSLGENAPNTFQGHPSEAQKCGNYPNTKQQDWRLVDVQYMKTDAVDANEYDESYVFLTRHATDQSHYRVSVYVYVDNAWEPRYCFGTQHNSKTFDRLAVSSKQYLCASKNVNDNLPNGPVLCWSYALYSTENPGDMKVYHTFNYYDNSITGIFWSNFISSEDTRTVGESNCVHDSTDDIVAAEVTSTNIGILVEATAHNIIPQSGITFTSINITSHVPNDQWWTKKWVPANSPDRTLCNLRDVGFQGDVYRTISIPKVKDNSIRLKFAPYSDGGVVVWAECKTPWEIVQDTCVCASGLSTAVDITHDENYKRNLDATPIDDKVSRMICKEELDRNVFFITELDTTTVQTKSSKELVAHYQGDNKFNALAPRMYVYFGEVDPENPMPIFPGVDTWTSDNSRASFIDQTNFLGIKSTGWPTKTHSRLCAWTDNDFSLTGVCSTVYKPPEFPPPQGYTTVPHKLDYLTGCKVVADTVAKCYTDGDWNDEGGPFSETVVFEIATTPGTTTVTATTITTTTGSTVTFSTTISTTTTLATNAPIVTTTTTTLHCGPDGKVCDPGETCFVDDTGTEDCRPCEENTFKNWAGPGACISCTDKTIKCNKHHSVQLAPCGRWVSFHPTTKLTYSPICGLMTDDHCPPGLTVPSGKWEHEGVTWRWSCLFNTSGDFPCPFNSALTEQQQGMFDYVNNEPPSYQLPKDLKFHAVHGAIQLFQLSDGYPVNFNSVMRKVCSQPVAATTTPAALPYPESHPKAHQSIRKLSADKELYKISTVGFAVAAMVAFVAGMWFTYK